MLKLSSMPAKKLRLRICSAFSSCASRNSTRVRSNLRFWHPLRMRSLPPKKRGFGIIYICVKSEQFYCQGNWQCIHFQDQCFVAMFHPICGAYRMLCYENRGQKRDGLALDVGWPIKVKAIEKEDNQQSDHTASCFLLTDVEHEKCSWIGVFLKTQKGGWKKEHVWSD